MSIIEGRVVRIGDDVDTDVMLAGKYLNVTDRAELGRHLFETHADAGLRERIEPGDIIVAGRNCGMGSSREHAPLAMLGRGVSAVVAESFARIFQRNCLNLGLLAIDHPEAARALTDGDWLHIDTTAGRLSWSGGEAELPPQPEFVQELLDSGGLVEWVRDRLRERA